MPSECGGSQLHPAYDPSVKLKANQVMVGDDLYTIREDERMELRAFCEHVGGRQHIYDIESNDLPKKVKRKIRQMLVANIDRSLGLHKKAKSKRLRTKVEAG